MIGFVCVVGCLSLYLYLFQKSAKAKEERDRVLVKQWFDLHIKDSL